MPYPLFRSSSGSTTNNNTPIKRARSFELKELLSTTRRPSLPPPPSRRPPSCHSALLHNTENETHVQPDSLRPPASDLHRTANSHRRSLGFFGKRRSKMLESESGPNLFDLSTAAKPPAHSQCSPGSSATLKQKVKGYFKGRDSSHQRDWRADDLNGLINNNASTSQPSTLTRASHESSANVAVGDSGQVTPRKNDPLTQLHQHRKELDSSLRYYAEVVRTGKIEMLGGSASIVMDVVLKLLGCLDQQRASASSDSIVVACRQVYTAVIEMIKWTDRKLLDKATVGDSPQSATNIDVDLGSTDTQETAEQLATQLRTAIDGVIATATKLKSQNRTSTDSGAASSTEDGVSPRPDSAADGLGGTSGNRSDGAPTVSSPSPAPCSPSPPPLPPRKKHAPKTRRKVSPPVSGDSGVFADAAQINQFLDENSNKNRSAASAKGPPVGGKSRLFSDNSLEDILAQLNLTCKNLGDDEPMELPKEARTFFTDDSRLLDGDGEATHIGAGKLKATNTSSQNTTSSNATSTSRRPPPPPQTNSDQDASHSGVNGSSVTTTTKSTTKVQQSNNISVSKGDKSAHFATSPSKHSPFASDLNELTSQLHNDPKWERLNQWKHFESTNSSLDLESADTGDLLYADADSPNDGRQPHSDNKQSKSAAANNNSRKIVVEENQNSLQGQSKPLTNSGAPPLPPRKARRQNIQVNGDANNRLTVTKTENMMHKSSTTQSVSTHAMVNGKLVESERQNKFDGSDLKASKSATFENGKMLTRQGSGAYNEESWIKVTRPANRRSSHEGNDDGAPPPPLPPKRKHVTAYMQVFRSHPTTSANPSASSSSRYSNGSGQQPSTDQNRLSNGSAGHQLNDFKKSTLASYVVLRDNLQQHEETYKRKAIAFRFSGSATDAMPVSTTPRADYSNLSDLLCSVNDNDLIQLPKKFAIEVTEPPKAIMTVASSRKSLPPAPTVLEELDAADWLVLRSRDGDTTGEVRGGPKDALLVYATQPGPKMLLYQEAFLTTYRTFIPSMELLTKLIRRYQYFNGPNCRTNVCEKKKSAKKTFSLIVRVVDELCCFEIQQDLVCVVNGFIYQLIQDGELNLSRLLRKRLIDRVEDKAGFKRALPLTPSKNQPASTNHRTCLLDIKSSALAEQLTCLDSELFQRVDLYEMLSWAKEQCEEKSPNLAAFTQHFNNLSYWARTKVLKHAEQKDRERYMWKFIKIMKNLRRLGNFNSYLALLSALDSGPVRRLDWSRTSTEWLKDYATIMDSSQSFKNYRTALAETKPPCLPYIGLILQDLTFVDVGNPDYIAADNCGGRKDLLNFGKRWQQFTILDSIRRFKGWHYPFEKDDSVLQVFGNFEDFLAEDDIWELSESIKPRGSRKTK